MADADFLNPFEDNGVPQGDKTNPLGRGIDNSVRGLLERLGVPGVSPQAPPLPTRGDGSIAAPTGAPLLPEPAVGPPPGAITPAPGPGPVTSAPIEPVIGAPTPPDDTIGQQVPLPAAQQMDPQLLAAILEMINRRGNVGQAQTPGGQRVDALGGGVGF